MLFALTWYVVVIWCRYVLYFSFYGFYGLMVLWIGCFVVVFFIDVGVLWEGGGYSR